MPLVATTNPAAMVLSRASVPPLTCRGDPVTTVPAKSSPLAARKFPVLLSVPALAVKAPSAVIDPRLSMVPPALLIAVAPAWTSSTLGMKSWVDWAALATSMVPVLVSVPADRAR